MLAGRTLNCWTCLLLGLVVNLPSSADLYWCETGKDRSAMVEQEIPGATCRLVQKDKEKTRPNASAPSIQKAPDEPPRQVQGKLPQKNLTSSTFPTIGDEEQFQRDKVREHILLEELDREKERLDLMRNQLASKNTSKLHKDLLEYYRRSMRNHLQNIKALQQELRRLE